MSDDVIGTEEGVRTRVLLALLGVLTIPLANARSASVGEDNGARSLKLANLAIASNGGTDLLRSGGDGELALEVEAVVERLLHDGSRARHVLVRRVGARADETDLDLVGPAVLLGLLGELGDGGGKVGGEGAVDVGLELGEVDLDDLVVLGALVGLEVVREAASVVGNFGTLGGLEVVGHARVEGEEGGGGTNFGTHVANGGHTSARERLDTLTKVLDDSACSALDGKDTGNLEDDV